jgi:hypothetical protein
MSVIIQIVWLISGMMSITEKLIPVIIATERDVHGEAPRSSRPAESARS